MKPWLLLLALGVPDSGIFPDLDGEVTLTLPPLGADVAATLDEKRRLLVLFDGPRAVKVYPLGGDARLGELRLRPADAAELAPILHDRPPRPIRYSDRDGDGIPDNLDVFLGAKKVALNAAEYGGDYIRIPFPGGDIPRTMGVCTDVIVRALRNAGIDLQKEIYDDIGRAPRAYPMVKRRDPNIDHRRVKTMVRWFERHWEAHGTDPSSTGDPFLPGDVVFFDTFVSKAGPDHVGIVSDRKGPSGQPLVINNWTEGYKESEMDLLGIVPVTHRYRLSASR